MIVVARILLVPYAIWILLLTLLPPEEAGRVTGIVAVIARVAASWGAPFDAVYAVLEFSANIVLFAPLGVLLALAWPRASAGALIAVGGASSVAIELAQLAIPGRFSTLSDVIANTLGTAVGVLVIRTLGRRRRRAGDGGHR
ncbi:VanZ family protein [uncultured Microbacterium sp.]|uniref:VanZ family protein n=1 Tax=uncultured Microbacterium sp. TaxID=191216 RepID=UPI0025DD798F|nr:VanZ family protein [uncultured Microbacterium sp.]